MGFLHQIQNKTPIIQRKVNFFADYFSFAVDSIGQNDEIEIETYSSLVSKMIFIVENKTEQLHSNLLRYIKHPLFTTNNSEFNYYASSNILTEQFKKIKKSNDVDVWLKRNPSFLLYLKTFRTELKRKLFKYSLREIISFLVCEHEIEVHRGELIRCTNNLIIEFIINGHTKDDIKEVFVKILSRDIKVFPFPKSFDKSKINSEELKHKYINSRNFRQQFEGIYNIFKSNLKARFFIFRILNLTADENFSTKFNKVQFIHLNHIKLQGLRKRIEKSSIAIKSFFEIDFTLLAIVPVKFHNMYKGAESALKLLKAEMLFLNKVCDSTAYADPSTYFFSKDFQSFGGKWRFKNNLIHKITKEERQSLLNNPVNFLKGRNKECREHILKREPIFIKALSLNEVEFYWQYLDALLPFKDINGKAQVVSIVSKILMLDAESNFQRFIFRYLESIIFHFDYPEELIGLSRERQQFYYNMSRTRKGIDWNLLKSEIKHPFLNYLFDLGDSPFNNSRIENLRSYYGRVLHEARVQRNFSIHNAIQSELSNDILLTVLPSLIYRLRLLIFAKWKKSKVTSFQELINQLLADVDSKLITVTSLTSK